MNFTSVRFLYGLLGTIVGAIIGLLASTKIFGSPNIKTIIIISAISFFVSFCWWEYIIKFWTDLSSTDLPLKHLSSKKEKNHEKRN
jgi:hypothetical protein